jgi:hypothetical protein
MPQWRLTLTLSDPFGRDVAYAIPIDEVVGEKLVDLRPLSTLDVMVEPEPLKATISVLKRKEFRKDLFIAEAGRLGALLAERMEDAEGFHDASRVDRAREQLGYKPRGR